MKLNKIAAAALTAASLLLATGTASAASVGGVTWNEASPIDFIAQSNLFEQVALTAGQTIQGYGEITSMNGSSSFCTTCELTFTFSGFTLQQTITGAPFSPFAFSGGTLSVWVSPIDYNAVVPSTAANGVLWLELQAKAGNFASFTGADANTTLYGGTSANSTLGVGVAGQGSGYFDAIGGLALAYFDTNSQVGGTDFLFTSNFSPLKTPISEGGTVYTHGGGATITGTSTNVPEPGVIALLGLGLAGIGAARRFKKAA